MVIPSPQILTRQSPGFTETYHHHPFMPLSSFSFDESVFSPWVYHQKAVIANVLQQIMISSTDQIFRVYADPTQTPGNKTVAYRPNLCCLQYEH
jgi:hypothetical protein